MNSNLSFSGTQFQHAYEKVLFWATIFLAEFHMFACSFREVLPGYSKPFFRLERWIGLAILLALLIYLGISVVRYPVTFRRLKLLFRRVWSFEQAYMLWVFVWYIVVLIVWQIVKGRGINLFKENDWWLFEQVLMTFVFFPLPCILGSERTKKLIEPMIKLVLIPHMVIWTWILLQYFRMNFISFPSGGKLQIAGYYMGLSFGYNQNITAAGSLIMMALCLYFIATQKSWRKLPYLFGVVVYLVILILTNCRTSWYCTLLIATSTCFLVIWFGQKKRHWFLRALIGILLAAGSVLFLQWLRGEMFILLVASHSRVQDSATLATTQAAVYTAQQNGGITSLTAYSTAANMLSSDPIPVVMAAEKGTAADYVRTYQTEVFAGSISGRVPLYKACLDVMFSRKLIFLFGLPSTDFGAAVYGRYGITDYYPHAHNFLLTMGVFYGVPTMIFTAAFLVSIFVRCFRVLFINKKPLFQGFWMIPVILAALVAEDMMESFLNLSAWSMTCITFYLFAGWIVAIDKEQRETKLKVERRENRDERRGNQGRCGDA